MRVNETFLAWTGHRREDLGPGTRFVSLLTVGSRIFYETRCGPLLLAGREVDQVSLDLRRTDGTAMPVLLAAKVRPSTGDGPAIVRIALVDLSERRRFEEQLVARNEALAQANVALAQANEALAQANAEYDAFTHAVAHDLHAPLRGIRQNTEFFLEDVAGHPLPDGTVDQLHTAVRLADRMRRMLEDLLDYAQAGREAFTPEAVSLRVAVAEVVELLGGRARDATLTVGDAEFVVDRAALGQVLLNLVANAVKYSTAPATISVDICTLEEARSASTIPTTLTGTASTTPVITVSDDGQGIEPAYRERIFELFRQIDPQAEGSGTGLALCRLICRRQGGDIWVESTPGAGSTFFALLSPRAADDAHVQA